MNDICWVTEMIAAMGRDTPKRRKSAALWPRCNAKLRKERTGQFCKASGCGFGARCLLHGGAAGCKRAGVRFVLFSSLDPLEPRRWSWWAVPLHFFERLPREVQSRPDPESVNVELGRLEPVKGMPQYSARHRWPQVLGYRIVARLAQRGRVAFVLFSEANRIAVLRATRESVPRPKLDVIPARVRVEGAVFAEAMALAGQSPKARAAHAPAPQTDDVSVAGVP